MYPLWPKPSWWPYGYDLHCNCQSPQFKSWLIIPVTLKLELWWLPLQAWRGPCWDWLVWCQCTVTGWDTKFDLQLVSQCCTVTGWDTKFDKQLVSWCCSSLKLSQADPFLYPTLSVAGLVSREPTDSHEPMDTDFHQSVSAIIFYRLDACLLPSCQLQSLELLKKKNKKRGNMYGGLGACSPWKMLRVETKICAIWGLLAANLKKSSTLQFIMKINFYLQFAFTAPSP